MDSIRYGPLPDIIETAVGETELSDELPDLGVAPIEDWVDPHELWPSGVGGHDFCGVVLKKKYGA